MKCTREEIDDGKKETFEFLLNLIRQLSRAIYFNEIVSNLRSHFPMGRGV